MKRLKGILYCIHNVKNDKVYIGQTISGKSRFNDHISKLNRDCHENNYLQNSWNKYGEDSFEFIILEHHNNLKDLNDAEEFYIITLESKSPYGYNFESGGKNYRVSESTKQKISESLLGYKRSAESIAKQKKTFKKKGLTAKCVAAMTKVTSKPVVQLSMEDEVVEIYASSAEASRKANISNGYLCRTLNGEFDKAKGYKWRYLNG